MLWYGFVGGLRYRYSTLSVRVPSLSWLDLWLLIRYKIPEAIAMFPYVWSILYDSFDMIFDMIPLIYDSHSLDTPLIMIMLWYDSDMLLWFYVCMYVCMLRSFLMPEFSNYSWRYHGRVIEAPMAWHFMWRCDWSTASPFCRIWYEYSLRTYDMCTPVLRAGCMYVYVCMYGGRMDAS